ncbi:growth hormone-regulated TBC protein 1 isoform X4 [Eulemur rufifrons]
MALSGAQARMDRNPGYYQRLLQGEGDPGLEDAVSTDLNRTFPDNVRFQKAAEPCLQQALYNVLVAYGRHDRGVGYCQGMNFIAGCLILVTGDEEVSFWLLDALVGRILPDYYGPGMLGLRTDQEVLGELVRTKLPAVGALLDRHGVPWALLVSRWFVCLFVDVLPVETVLRIWDCLFNEGSKIIFRVALTLIKHHQALILEATSVPDICDKFKRITKGSFAMQCHTFMQVSAGLRGAAGSVALPVCPPQPVAVTCPEPSPALPPLTHLPPGVAPAGQEGTTPLQPRACLAPVHSGSRLRPTPRGAQGAAAWTAQADSRLPRARGQRPRAKPGVGIALAGPTRRWRPGAQLTLVFSETGSHCRLGWSTVARSQLTRNLSLLGSSDPPASASRGAGITDVSHHLAF